MVETLSADASPEKRLFISLLTRDIPLTAAFLDLIDNSINAAIEPYSNRLETAQDYLSVLDDGSIVPNVDIRIHISKDQVQIDDTAGGISSKTAREHVFKFGRGVSESHERDRLSVYGIGLKRAIFKIGNRIKMISDHSDGGFDLDLDVAKWEKDTKQPWTFAINPRPPADPENCGTSIVITDLFDEVTRRISDGVFEGELADLVSRTYSFFISKFVKIYIETDIIEGTSLQIGSNHASEEFEIDGVTCAITAGIGIPEGGRFRDRSSGWFVFCNGRAVVFADKTPLTGWGGAGLPIFQPKHRPFLGTVFFVSPDPEKLPWTTTKSAINQDSALWQSAKRHMAAAGRAVVSFLDGRYTDEGTGVSSKELQEAAGNSSVNVVVAAASEGKKFTPPKKPKPETIRIQYDAKLSDVKSVAEYLRNPGMSGSDVGRHTFFYFLRNEVGES
jgi:hypothetical protein